MADRLTTGILLVGGASARFGSPKALAPFRGETLAERAWRVLGEVCDERIAVGKQADEVELPFPVLDDHSVERAPVFGVIAGIRVASNDVCLVLPVDCPLVTPDLLRALASEVAVPQTGPLPGAYERSSIDELEARVARGELSLRGFNAATIELDERLLVNVNTRIELLEAAIADWASSRDDVRAAVVVGSQTRNDWSADRWSDLDVVLVLDDPEPYAADAGWVGEFGEPVLTFLEPAAVGDERERRVLYATGEEVDFPLIPVTALDRLEKSEGAAETLRRGFRVLVDEIGLEDRFRRLAEVPAVAHAPTQEEFTELVSDFWYHALWAAKKLRRGEILTAHGCLDRLLLSSTVTMLAWHATAVDPSVDTWHGTRFVERWADPGALAALQSAFPRYDVRDVARALWATIDLWQGLEDETARRLGLALEVDDADLRRRVAEVVPDSRRGTSL